MSSRVVVVFLNKNPLLNRQKIMIGNWNPISSQSYNHILQLSRRFHTRNNQLLSIQCSAARQAPQSSGHYHHQRLKSCKKLIPQTHKRKVQSSPPNKRIRHKQRATANGEIADVFMHLYYYFTNKQFSSYYLVHINCGASALWIFIHLCVIRFNINTKSMQVVVVV